MDNTTYEMNSGEKQVVKFITGHPGCSKAEIVRHMEKVGPVSRITTLKYIENLEAEKIIICRLEKPNSQIYQVYINEESKLGSLLGELEEFKDAYFNLLGKTKEILNKRDYSADAKALGIEETDPAKWKMDDKIRYLEQGLAAMEKDIQKSKGSDNSELHNMIANIKAHLSLEDDEPEYYTTEQSLQRSRDFIKSVDAIISDLENKPASKRQGLERFLLPTKLMMTEIKDSLKVNESIRTNVKNYPVVFLTLNAINFFNILTEIMFYRSTMKWSAVIQNREMLSQMYSIVYSKIVEIQLQLSKFLESLKIGIIGSSVARYIVMARSSIKIEDLSLSIIYACYSDLGLQSEIKSIQNAISKLKEEIRDLGYMKGYDRIKFDQELEKFIENLDPSLYLDRTIKRIDAILSGGATTGKW